MLQDFQGVNLKGRSFKGQNLTGANFSGADIRSANFTNAILLNTNFSHVKAGQQLHWVVGIIIGAFILAIISGFISAYAAAFMGSLLFNDDSLSKHFFSLITLLTLTLLCVVTIRKGLGSALVFFTVMIAATVAIVAAIGEIGIAGPVVLLAIVIAEAIAGVMVGGLAVAIAKVMTGVVTVALVGTITLAGAIPGAIAGVEGTSREGWLGAFAVTGAVTLVLLGMSIYIGWQAIAGNKKYHLICSLAIAISATGGTSFRGANLTDANFTKANLKSVDLRQANLTRTCWFRAKKLEQARLEGTYLENIQVRKLVIEKNGQEQNWDYLDMRGLNLEGANLADASFIGANLSESTLQNANLSRAKLVQAHLYQSNLTGSCLTGAYIQDWAISTDTTLNEVKCEYIYMQLPTKDDPDPCRKPDNKLETFKDGDFSDFIAPIIKTLDLYRHQNVDPRAVASTFKTLDFYHHEGIDPSAAAIALKQLSDQYPQAGLKVVALEGRGEDKIRLQATVSGGADRSELSAKYFEDYSKIKSLPYNDIQALLKGIEEKDDRIRSLESMVITAIKSQKFYAETYYNLGDTMSEKSSIDIQGGGDVNVSGLAGRDISGTGMAVGDISGTVTQTIGQLQETETPEAPKLAELLQQVQIAIEAEPDLSEEDKAEALEQVRVLAEVGQNPEEGGMKKLARTAMKILKGTIIGLPSASQLVGELLPAITDMLGLN